jgi:hypothetical protein
MNEQQVNTTTTKPTNWSNVSVYSLQKELQIFLKELRNYSGVGSLMNKKDQEEINEYWRAVELCRKVAKKMEQIYERY